jgi:hypothetical protein
MTPARTPRAGTTTAAGVLTIVVTVLWALFGIVMLVVGAVVDQAELVDELDVEGDLRDAIAGIIIGAGLVVLAISAWTMVLGIKVLQRRSWARWGAVVTFSLFAVLFLFGVVGTLSSDDTNGDGGGQPVPTIAIAAVNLLIVVLLLLRPTKDDFERAEAAERGGGYGWGQPQGPWDQQQWGTGWAPPQQQHQPGWGQPPSSVPPTQSGWAAPQQPQQQQPPPGWPPSQQG